MRLSIVLATLAALWAAPAAGETKITIGAVEEVILLPWGIRLPARIDTGATTSSIHTREVVVIGKEVELRLAPDHGWEKIRLPIVRWKTIKTSEGKDLRPVVRLEICLSAHRFSAEVNVNDRSEMKHPFLIGRDLLRGRFVVDVERQRLLPPRCP